MLGHHCPKQHLLLLNHAGLRVLESLVGDYAALIGRPAQSLLSARHVLSAVVMWNKSSAAWTGYMIENVAACVVVTLFGANGLTGLMKGKHMARELCWGG